MVYCPCERLVNIVAVGLSGVVHSLGNYIHIEASVPAALGHVGRLRSPLLTPRPQLNSRLSFWYHMYGFDIDCLSVNIL